MKPSELSQEDRGTEEWTVCITGGTVSVSPLNFTISRMLTSTIYHHFLVPS